MKFIKDTDPRRPLKLITVGVFPPDGGSRTYMAYTLWYSPQWPRCCEHEVEAVNGTEAKKIAIREHKERCEGHEVADVEYSEVEIECAESDEPECQHMAIIGKEKHYCDSSDEHDGPHHCQCGREWNE